MRRGEGERMEGSRMGKRRKVKGRLLVRRREG